jgi:hypothetical protein
MKKTVQDRIAFLEERIPIPSRQKSTELTQEDKAALIKFVKFVEDLALAKGISLKQAWTSIGPILKRDRERERRTKNLKTLKALQKLQWS